MSAPDLRVAGPDQPRPTRGNGRRWALLSVRLLAIACAAWLAVLVPLPLLDEWLPVRDVVVVAAGVALAGKCLFDTLFFDHFRR